MRFKLLMISIAKWVKVTETHTIVSNMASNMKMSNNPAKHEVLKQTILAFNPGHAWTQDALRLKYWSIRL